MIVDYSSDEDDKIIKKAELPKKKIKFNPVQPVEIKLNPDSDITELVKEQKAQELEIFKQNNPELFEDKSDNHVTGYVRMTKQDEINISEFDEQQRNFRIYGFAYDPDNENPQQRIVVNENIHPELYERVIKGETISETELMDARLKAYGLKNKEDKQVTKNLKEKREQFGNAGDGDFQGPWAKYKDEQVKNIQQSEEDKEKIEKIEKKRLEQLEEEKVENQKTKYERVTTQFHLSEKYDYQGRGILVPPSELKPHDHTCYIPKKCVKIWSDHQKGVQCIKFFPKFGHYLLSASLDHTIKLWSTTGDKNLTRTYMGHNQAVRDICFTSNGYHFLSGGYDKQINYWDTEKGKIVQNIKLKAFPYSIKIHPDESKEHSFLLGSSNKRVMQFDLRTGNRTQVYDEHLGAINTITFIDHNRKFVSTSEDRKIFVWEYGIPVVVKHLAEPDMQSVSKTVVSSNYQYMAAQQSNNKIAIYDLKGGNFRLNRKKTFTGHKSVGYAVGVTFSPDGRYIGSGDSDGRAFFWDWKTGKNYRAIDAHDGVCIDIAWHPIETSKVATCGWDGLIKYWD